MVCLIVYAPLPAVIMSKASCGLRLLYSFTKAFNVRCCVFKSNADGIAQDAFRSRCIRSCLPFCSGCDGSENTGKIPSSINQYDNLEKRCIEVAAANGDPLSVWTCLGSPNILKTLVNSFFTDFKSSCK